MLWLSMLFFQGFVLAWGVSFIGVLYTTSGTSLPGSSGRIGLSQWEYWGGFPPGDLLTQGLSLVNIGGPAVLTKAVAFTVPPAMCVWAAQSCPTLTPRTVACQAALSVEFSRQGYWSGLPFPSPEELSNPGVEAWTPVLQAGSLLFELPQCRLSESRSVVSASATPQTAVHGSLQTEHWRG